MFLGPSSGQISLNAALKKDLNSNGPDMHHEDNGAAVICDNPVLLIRKKNRFLTVQMLN